jgi:hypothetical protein
MHRSSFRGNAFDRLCSAHRSESSRSPQPYCWNCLQNIANRMLFAPTLQKHRTNKVLVTPQFAFAHNEASKKTFEPLHTVSVEPRLSWQGEDFLGCFLPTYGCDNDVDAAGDGSASVLARPEAKRAPALYRSTPNPEPTLQLEGSVQLNIIFLIDASGSSTLV